MATTMLTGYDEHLDDEQGAYGDARRCPRHPHVATSSPDGLFDGPCGECEAEMEAAYYAPRDVDTTPGPFVAAEQRVACAACGQWLRDGEIVRNHPVYKGGDLAYIEILHVACPAADPAPGALVTLRDPQAIRRYGSDRLMVAAVTPRGGTTLVDLHTRHGRVRLTLAALRGLL